ncbi:hypothetical protein LTR84_009791 [Exophiala bonariae]|uniref:Uncharacterized protein n=1 Tax=Exophiala bonariae TaxID=1690606 RepID=A0AAV9NLS1_9EURO|nr:hypothetical protein LTR84_009791 [Exophiala bonariae]
MAQKDPLSSFQRLSGRIFLHIPNESGDSKQPSSYKASVPDFVVVCAWAFSQPRRKFPNSDHMDPSSFLSGVIHAFALLMTVSFEPSGTDTAFVPDVAKYIAHYQLLYPNARILLLFNTVHNMLWVPDSVQMKELQPAVQAIDEFLDSHDARVTTAMDDAESKHCEPTIFFHIFSNGGAHMAVQLGQAYRDNGRVSSPTSSSTSARQLPISAVVFDSCPGHARYATAGKTTLSFLPKDAHVARTLAMPVVYLLLGGFYLCHVLGVAEHVVIKLWRELNSPTGPFLFKGSGLHSKGSQVITDPTAGQTTSNKRVIPRAYICSQADDMIPSQDIFEHAAIARHSSGLSDDAAKDVIRVEEFVESMHVNHVSLYKERYWAIIGETLGRI